MVTAELLGPPGPTARHCVLCPEGGYRVQPRVEWHEDKGGLGGSRLGKAVGNPTQAGSLCYINFSKCETMSQKQLPGDPRTNGNHADRLM